MADRHTPSLPSTFDREAHPVEFGRVLALSDGVFAIALTLLVLDIALPAAAMGGNLAEELADRQAHFFAFAISLLLVGTGWWSHHHLFTMLRAVDARVIGMNIVYLGLIVLVPFAQSVLAGYPTDPLAYVLFAGVLTGIGAIDASIFAYSRHAGLQHESVTRAVVRQERVMSAAFTLTFLLSMPFAFVLVQYTGLIWVTLPVTQVVLVRLLARERPEARAAAR